jgi:hypothetical protein
MYSRVICLKGAECLGGVRDGPDRLGRASARLDERVLRRRVINEVADPSVPAGFDLGGVEVVLCVLDPAGAQGQLLVVLKVLVSGAVLAHEGAGLGVA